MTATDWLEAIPSMPTETLRSALRHLSSDLVAAAIRDELRERVCANHMLHARVGRNAMWLTLECLPGRGHITVNAENWSFDDIDQFDDDGLVDRSECWVHQWLSEYGNDLLHGPDEWDGDGPWPVRCWFDNDSMVVEQAELALPPVEIPGQIDMFGGVA